MQCHDYIGPVLYQAPLQPTTSLELQLGAWDVRPCSISNKDVCLIRLMMLVLQIASLVPEINA